MKRILAILLFITLIMGLVACGADREKELYGVWTVKDIVFSDSSLITEYEIADFETTYKETVLRLKEDKTGTLSYIGKDYDISWRLEDSSNLLIFIDGLLFTEIGVSDEELVLSVDKDKVLIGVNLIKRSDSIDNTSIGDSIYTSTVIADSTSNKANYSPVWESHYANVLDDVMIEFPNHQYHCNYALYDIDGDYVPELFVKVGTCNADYEYRVFTISENVVLIDTMSASHSSVCGIQDTGSFLLTSGHMGYERISKVTMSNNNFTEEELFDGEVEEYHDFQSLEFYELDDREGLNWTANYVENNQQILDYLKTEITLTSSEELEYGLYSTAPILAKGCYIIPDSFDIYGRVSLDEVSYGYYEGYTPKDPYRLTLVINSTEKNWYFIQKIYMDTLIFDESGEEIKCYHTEYPCHDMTENLNKIETWGSDNSNPQNQSYNIKENWSDFPQNAHSASILLSFDVFAKTEFGIHTSDTSVSVQPYEVRYVEPQTFDAFVDVLDGKMFEHRG